MALCSMMVLVVWLLAACFQGEWSMALGLVCTFIAGIEGGGHVMYNKIMGRS